MVQKRVAHLPLRWKDEKNGGSSNGAASGARAANPLGHNLRQISLFGHKLKERLSLFLSATQRHHRQLIKRARFKTNLNKRSDTQSQWFMTLITCSFVPSWMQYSLFQQNKSLRCFVSNKSILFIQDYPKIKLPRALQKTYERLIFQTIWARQSLFTDREIKSYDTIFIKKWRQKSPCLFSFICYHSG